MCLIFAVTAAALLLHLVYGFIPVCFSHRGCCALYPPPPTSPSELLNKVAAFQEATLKKEGGGDDTMGLTPAQLQKKAKEEEKERKKREKEEEKRRKKEEEDRKKAEKASKKGKGKGPVDPTAEDRRDHLVREQPQLSPFCFGEDFRYKLNAF